MSIRRRHFLMAGGAALASGLAGCATMPAAKPKARVVIVGGGYGGATAARYIRMLDPAIEVTLVEANEAFVSCPLSNMVLGGFKTLAEITRPYSGLERRGVRVVRDTASVIDLEKKQVRLARGGALPFDRAILSPGVDFIWEALPAMANEAAQGEVLHAWKAGPQTGQLRRQLEAMPDGGIYALAIPEAPYRCPPGPYERACHVPAYFNRPNPNSKVLLLH